MITLFLCGDVMTGRGIDQILPHPGDPTLHESYVRDARGYLELAEAAYGPIPRPAAPDYIWGDALEELDRARTDLRIVNLETSITRSDAYWRGKEVLYRMHPGNIGCLAAARIDCCCLANNHVLDWGYEGLEETLDTLDGAGVAHAGAGRDVAEAAAPAVLDAAGKGRVLVFAFGSPTSGVPRPWGAAANRPGVNLLEDLSEETALACARRIRGIMQPGDTNIASIHWGPNWGYAIPREQIDFARRLVENGVDIVHGHSSHHAKAVEVHQGRLILHGCGDFLTDYEGIGGYEMFRGDLCPMYLIEWDPLEGRLVNVRIVALRSRRFRLCRAPREDARWLCDMLNRQGSTADLKARLEDDHSMTLRWR